MIPAMKPVHIRTLSALLTLCLVAFPEGSTAAKTVKRIKVLGMQIEGTDLSATDKGDLFRVVQAALRSYAQVDLLKPPERELTDEMIDLECVDVDADCLSRLGKKYKAERVFYSQVDKAKAGAYTLLVRVVDVSTGKATHDSKTKVPNRMGIANQLEKQVAKVFGGGKKVAPGPKKDFGYISIKVENQPAAKIFVDKEFAGTGEVKVKRKVGEFTVKVTADGYAEQLFGVKVTPGRTTTRSVVMKPVGGTPISTPDDGSTVEPEFYETWWFWTIVGVVVVGGVTGIVVATTSDSGSQETGSVTFSVDPQQSWRDIDVQGVQP